MRDVVGLISQKLRRPIETRLGNQFLSAPGFRMPCAGVIIKGASDMTGSERSE